MIPVDELRPLSAARLLALWRDCREAAEDPLERTLLCNARVLAACCYREGAPAFADEEEVLTTLTGRQMERLLERLVRDGELTTESSSFSDSAYGALCLDKATSLGFCQAYLLLLRKMSIPCHLVHGTYGVEKMVWCQLQLDGERYYVDPARSLVTGDTAGALIPEASLTSLGYVLDE